jgi:hypothetical protein
MFRRADVDWGDGLFTWSGKAYHCLADLALWLRLLARGGAYYCASALSEYRVHRGQEQRTLGIDCITERFDLVMQARAVGFLREPAQVRAALARVDNLAKAWSARPSLPAADREALADLGRAIEASLAKLP